MFPGAIRGRRINTENSVIRETGVTLEDRNSAFGSVSTSVIPSRPGGEKKMGAHPVISYIYLMVYLIMVDMSFS